MTSDPFAIAVSGSSGMAPKRKKYDAARLVAAAAKATKAADKEVRKVHAEEFELKCSYVASDAKIKKDTVVDFE